MIEPETELVLTWMNGDVVREPVYVLDGTVQMFNRPFLRAAWDVFCKNFTNVHFEGYEARDCYYALGLQPNLL